MSSVSKLKPLSKQSLKRMHHIFKAKQPEVIRYMTQVLANMYGAENIEATTQFVVAKGEIPIGLVAHADTVHLNPVKNLFYDQEASVCWSPEGLGADDRAGVFAILEILKTGLRPTVIITTDEEIGGLGAYAVCGQLTKKDVDVKFLIELDRRGSQDSVFYDLDSEKFEEYINEFGFVTNWGSFSDISIICPQWNVCGVNLSIGYYNEHTKQEYLKVDEMFATISRVCNILQSQIPDIDMSYKELPTSAYWKKQTWNSGAWRDVWGGSTESERAYAYYDEEDYGIGIPDEIPEGGEVDSYSYCFGCMSHFPREEVKEVEADIYYCNECYDKIYLSCVTCGEDFYNYNRDESECNICRAEGEISPDVPF